MTISPYSLPSKQSNTHFEIADHAPPTQIPKQSSTPFLSSLHLNPVLEHPSLAPSLALTRIASSLLSPITPVAFAAASAVLSSVHVIFREVIAALNVLPSCSSSPEPDPSAPIFGAAANVCVPAVGPVRLRMI